MARPTKRPTITINKALKAGYKFILVPLEEWEPPQGYHHFEFDEFSECVLASKRMKITEVASWDLLKKSPLAS